jgi:hypothetical protein
VRDREIVGALTLRVAPIILRDLNPLEGGISCRCVLSGKLRSLLLSGFETYFLSSINLARRSFLPISPVGSAFLNMLHSGILRNWDPTMTIPLTKFCFALGDYG